MKKVTFKLIVCIAASISFGSCTDDFDEVNTDPLAIGLDNIADDPLLQAQVFNRALYRTFHANFQTGQNLSGDLWTQYFATTQSRFESDRYVMVGGWISNQWSSHYTDEFKLIKSILDITEERGDVVPNAMAKIAFVHAFQRLTDYFGPMPFSEMGNLELEQVPYDSQEDIYAQFFVLLDEAVAQLRANPGAIAYPSGDRIYGGNADSWLKFANSLRLRVAMRTRYADPATAQAQAERAVADGVFLENSDGAYVATDDTNRNQFETITDWGEFRMSALAESILKGYEDPRLPTMYAPADDGDQDGDGDPFEGLLNGQSVVTLEAGQNDLHSDMATKWIDVALGGENPSYTAQNTAEVYFLRAEGATLGWNMGGTAKDLYEEGIRMSMTELTDAGAAAIDAYINSTNTPVPYEPGTVGSSDIPVAFEAADAERQLEQIITQKWIANYPNGYESWAELRRTGYPRQYARVSSDNPNVANDEILRRMIYPTVEFDRNPLEVQNAIDNLLGGPDNAGTRLWWDAK